MICVVVGLDGNIEFGGKCIGVVNVIVMFVCDEDGVEGFGCIV